jgi:uncharacterized protein (UPF0335 family)
MTEVKGRNSIAGELLRGFVERFERINEQMDDLRDDKRVVAAEAQKEGLVPKAINFIVKKRKQKPSERAEEESLQAMYLHAIGMAPDNPLFRAVGLMSVDIASREAVIEAMKQFVPSSGSIEVEAEGKRVRLTRDKDGVVSVTEVVERAVTTSADPNRRPASTPRADIPQCTSVQAEALGHEAFGKDVPIVQNPFPFGHENRPYWDRGWRRASGGDGMGPEE